MFCPIEAAINSGLTRVFSVRTAGKYRKWREEIHGIVDLVHQTVPVAGQYLHANIKGVVLCRSDDVGGVEAGMELRIGDQRFTISSVFDDLNGATTISFIDWVEQYD